MRPHVFLRDRDAEAALGASPSIEGWIESLPLPALVADEAAYVLLANRAALRFFGYHERELHGMPLERLIPELAQDADSRRAIFAKLEREAGEEATARLRNDETVPVGYGLNLIDWGGRPATAISFFDLSACKRADRERERTILDATSAVIYVKGADGRYQFVNRKFAELFHRDPVVVIGKTDYDIFPKDFADAFSANDREVIESGDELRVEETAPHDDGPHTYFTIKVPVRDSHGMVRAVAGISTDITDHLRAIRAEEDLMLARMVQQRLYPTAAPAAPGLDVAGASSPMSHLCGDYYDFIPCEGQDRLLLAVGDVSGHGLGPALKMVEIRALLRLVGPQSTDLAEVFRRVNAVLLEDSPESYFITLFLAELDFRARTVRHVGAGHDAWLLRADGTEVRLDSGGLPLGVMDETWESPAPVALASGDMLLLTTDGLTEATSPAGEPFGRDRLLATARALAACPAREIVGGLLDAGQDFSGDGFHDDVTIIVAKMT